MSNNQLEKELASIFFEESNEMLATAEAALLAGERSGDVSRTVNTVFRAVHSIKGGAQSLGLEPLAELTHRGEDFLEPLRNQSVEVDAELYSLMLEFIDLLKYQLEKCQSDPSFSGSIDHANALFDKLATRLSKSIQLQTSGSLKFASCAEANTISVLHKPIFLSATVDVSYAMPLAYSTLLSETLRTKGQMLYENFEHETRQVSVVILTELSSSEIKTLALQLGEWQDLTACVLEKTIPDITYPSKEDIDYANELICRLSFYLSKNLSESPHTVFLMRELSLWGQQSGAVMQWFPGGYSAWISLTDLLKDAISDKKSGQTDCTFASRLLQTIWETLYFSLCNRTYYRTLGINQILPKNLTSTLDSILTEAFDLKFLLIDLSEFAMLENDMIVSLTKLRAVLKAKHISMQLFSSGMHTRRHMNIFEATASITGSLRPHPTPFSAVMEIVNFSLEEVT